MDTRRKLEILADAAKYDASCASGGSRRAAKPGGLGATEGMGICHSYTEDGRCVSLLKILLTNHCIFDCAYCISRRSNDIQRAAFTVQEVVDLTINFYRRNYIEGLFLSSGIFKNADYTMERLVRIAKELREIHNFHGYIHLKAIPGASPELLTQAGKYADRLSVNIELPSEESLKRIAPEKNYEEIYTPMNFIREEKQRYTEERKSIKSAPLFVPAGQSTQLIVGASPENDLQILNLADALYQKQQLKRVYYSAYIPIKTDSRMPDIVLPPTLRENRIYQADWLLRFYKFSVTDIVNDLHPNLDYDIDPKLSYALRNRAVFPIDINKAEYEMILRVPGIGVKSAQMIITSRRFGNIHFDHLKKMGIVIKRAQYFISCPGAPVASIDRHSSQIRQLVQSSELRKRNSQLTLFA